MSNEIERPVLLTPTHGKIFGNERSKAIVDKAYDECFKWYKELINDGWQHGNALLSARNTLTGTLESRIHMLVEEADGNE